MDSLIYILQKRIIKFYQNQYADEEKFLNLVCKLHHQMKVMENHKYLEPKSSCTFDELVIFLKKVRKEVSSVNATGGCKGSEMGSIHTSEFDHMKHLNIPIFVKNTPHSQ